MRYTHPNPLRSEGESRQRRGAKDLAALAQEAITNRTITVRTITREEVVALNISRAAEDFSVRSVRSKRAGKASARSPATRAKALAWKNQGVPK